MQGSTGGEDEDGGVLWTTIGGQSYAVPIKKKKPAVAQSPGEPAAEPTPDQTKAAGSPKVEPAQAATQAQSSTGGWGWLGFGSLANAAKDVPALNAGLGLAESTLSGLYNAVSSSAAYIVQPLAEDEPAPLPSEQEKKELAITTELVDFVQNVTDHPSTFTNFPVETDKGPQPARLVRDGVYPLSSKQTKHVTAMLALVPKLQTLRHDLVPAQLGEDTFWQVYFSLIERKTDSVDWERDKMEQPKEEAKADEWPESEEEAEETEAVKRKRGLTAKVQYRREMILGYDEDASDDDADQQSNQAHLTLSELRRVWEAHKTGYMSATKSSQLYGEDSVHLEELWQGMLFSGKEPGRLIREQFRHLIRQGIAPTKRTTLWPLMAEALVMMRRTPTLYEEALQNVYITEEGKQELAAMENESEESKNDGNGDLDAPAKEKEKETSEPEAPAPAATVIRILPSLEVPKTFSRVPNFGGKLISISHWLGDEGTAAAKRLLTVFAIQNPEWDYVPCLPDLVLLLLHYLPEPTVYFVMVSVLSKTISGSTQRFVNRSKREVDTTVCTLVDCLLAPHLPRLHTHLTGQCRDAMISGGFQKEMQQWLERFFVGVLPQQAAFKVVDHALVDGVTALYRVALRILKANEEDLLQATNGQEFMVRLRAIAQRCIERDVDDTFLFSSQKTQLFAELTPAQVLLAETKAQEANPQLDSLEDPSLSTSSLPTVKESSLVLSQEQFEVIWQWLPSRYRVKNPVRHFSSSKDGFSILSIYRKCQKSAPHLFIVKTKQGKIFGAYLTDGWKQAQKFYGSGESFLFTVHPLPRKFGWTTANKDLFMIGNEKDIMIGGGGGCGIWLDSELWHGTSEYCETFRNDPLNGSSKFFEAVAVEIYGFSS